MAHPAYVRDKARKLRLEQGLSIVEIAQRLNLSKTTIYYWVRDIPLQRPRRANPGQRRGNRGMRRKYRELREAAYAEGRDSFQTLCMSDSTFRDFVCMYIGEGYKRSRNAVSISNSDPRVAVLATHWLRALSSKTLRFSVQYHLDQDPWKLAEFWGSTLRVDPAEIRMQPKKNSGRLKGRVWRCTHGVIAVAAWDTLLRARLQAWMDCVQEQWLHSPADGA
jgi:AcrR family transcriptional regulator